MIKIDGPSVDAGLGGRTADDTHRLTRPLRVRALVWVRCPRTRQAAQVPDAAIRLDALQSLEVHANLSAQITLNDIFAVLNGVDYL